MRVSGLVRVWALGHVLGKKPVGSPKNLETRPGPPRTQDTSVETPWQTLLSLMQKEGTAGKCDEDGPTWLLPKIQALKNKNKKRGPEGPILPES